MIDFCLWAPSDPNSLIADTEGEEVAWCTKPGRGTRVIPPGALTGVQFMKTPDYLQAVGFIDQTKINLQQGDYGGELDPHGADLVSDCLSYYIDSVMKVYSEVTLSVVSCTPTDSPAITVITTRTNKSSNGTSTSFILLY